MTLRCFCGHDDDDHGVMAGCSISGCDCTQRYADVRARHRAERELAISEEDNQPDAIDHPAHYGGRDNPYEAIKVMLAWHGPIAVAWFCRLSAEKYLCRAGLKKGENDGSGDALVRDLRKAAWYAATAADVIEFGELR